MTPSAFGPNSVGSAVRTVYSCTSRSPAARATAFLLTAAAAVLLTTACAAAPPSSAPAPSAAPAEASAAPSQVRTVRIAYRGGQATGDTGTVAVLRGVRVRLEVTSDVAEEAHLHGYDREVRLVPGVPAIIDLTADIPGEFEFELHGTGAQLATLQVR